MSTRIHLTVLFLAILLHCAFVSQAATVNDGKPLKQATRASVVRRAMRQPARRAVSAVPLPPPVLCGSVAAGVPFTVTTTCATTVNSAYCGMRLVQDPSSSSYLIATGASTTSPNLRLNSACGLETISDGSTAYYSTGTATFYVVFSTQPVDGNVLGTCTVSSAGLLSCAPNFTGDTSVLGVFNNGRLVIGPSDGYGRIDTNLRVSLG